MAGLLSAQLLGQRQFKVVNAITGTPSLNGVGVKDVEIILSSKLMVNTSEDGSPIIDARIVLPTEIAVSLVTDSTNSLDEINSLLQDTDSPYHITTRGVALRNFMLESESFSQTANMLSATPATLKFKQLLFQNGGGIICENSGDSSSVMGGIKSPINVAVDKVEELTSRLVSTVTKVFGG